MKKFKWMKFVASIICFLVGMVAYIGFSLHQRKVAYEQKGEDYKQMLQAGSVMNAVADTTYIKGINLKNRKEGKTPKDGGRIFLDKIDLAREERDIQCAVLLAKDEPNYISQDSVGQYVWYSEFSAIYINRNTSEATSTTGAAPNTVTKVLTEEQATTRINNILKPSEPLIYIATGRVQFEYVRVIDGDLNGVDIYYFGSTPVEEDPDGDKFEYVMNAANGDIYKREGTPTSNGDKMIFRKIR